MLNQQLSESPLSLLTGQTQREREEVKETGMGYTHLEDLNILKCEILRKGTVEDKTLYVWTSVSWGPEKKGQGKCFLSLLIPHFFLLPLLFIFLFFFLVKLITGEASPQQHVTVQEPNG